MSDGVDRAATASADGYEMLTLFRQGRDNSSVGFMTQRPLPVNQAKAVHDLSPIFAWFYLLLYPDLLSPSLFLKSIPAEKSHVLKSLYQAVISWWPKLRKQCN